LKNIFNEGKESKPVNCRLISIIISLFLLGGCFSGTQELKEYYEPLNIIQQEFYDIQTLYDTNQYKDVVQLGEIFIRRYPRDILSVSVKYYVGSSYQKTNNLDEAEEYYKDILTNHSEDDWAKLATVGLREIADLRKAQ
jgi:outer membrane protein assembly factor BamD (BamD/ComL family)